MERVGPSAQLAPDLLELVLEARVLGLEGERGLQVAVGGRAIPALEIRLGAREELATLRRTPPLLRGPVGATPGRQTNKL